MSVLALLVCAGITQATYTNPVYAHNFPDPFVVEDQGTFYAYGTQGGGPGFQVMTSRDLVHWEHHASVGKPSWSGKQLWAPEVYHFEGKWYLFFAARNPQTNKRDLGVSVANSPLGPFEDWAVLVPGISENSGPDDNGAIDATVYSENGKHYLLYIREAPPRAIKIAELAPDFRSLVGRAEAICIVDRKIENGILDAPTLIKKDGAYWLFFSGGWFQSSKADASYRIWDARSRSLLGPYIKADKPIIEGVEGKVYNPGHQCVLQLSSGEWWIVYHAWDANGDPRYSSNKVGRTLRIDRLLWDKSGPQPLIPSTSAQTAPTIGSALLAGVR